MEFCMAFALFFAPTESLRSHTAVGGCPRERGERFGAFGSPRAAATSPEPHGAGAMPLR